MRSSKAEFSFKEPVLQGSKALAELRRRLSSGFGVLGGLGFRSLGVSGLDFRV